MLLVLSPNFLTYREPVKKSIIDLITRTIDKVVEDLHTPSDTIPENILAVQTEDFKWGKYNKNHNVAIKFVEKPKAQWYWDEDAQMYIVECYTPSKVVGWAEGYPEFYYAFEKAYNFDYYKGLAEAAENVSYDIVTNAQNPIFQHVVEHATFLGCDIETRGFDWKNDAILVHGFCYAPGKVMIIPHKYLEDDPGFMAAFKALVEDPDKTFIWQNGKFDTKFYRYQGWNARIDEDTMLMSYAQDERGGGIHGLEYQATKILNTDGYKHKIKFETVDPMDASLHYYLAQDCIYTALIYAHHRRMLDKEVNAHSLKLYRTILLQASWALLRLEENGFYVRREYTEALEVDFRTRLDAAESALTRLASEAGYTPEKFVAWSGQKSIPKGFKCSAPKQLAYVLIGVFGLPKHKGVISTDVKAIQHWLFNTLDFPVKDEYAYLDTSEDVVQEWYEKSKDSHIRGAKEFLWNLVQFRKLAKMYSTYITNALEYSQGDGRVHVTYKINGTVTGRLSSGDPMNLQNIPRRKDIKCIFGAPEGKTLIECDYSQCIRKGTKVYSTSVSIEDHPDAVYKGEAPIFEVRTEKGYTVQCTEEHQILTHRGWVEARDLKAGDFIALQGQEVFDTNPDPLSRFVGFFAGDGSYGTNSITLARGEDKYLGDVLQIIRNAGLFEGSMNQNSIYISTDVSFRQELKTLVDKKDLRIPEKYLAPGMRNVLAGYLGGLFDADGYADSNCVAVSTKYLDFAKDIQKALLGFGVLSRIIYGRGGYNLIPGGKEIYRVQISDSESRDNFNRLIGFSINLKKEIAKNTKKSALTNFLPTLKKEDVLALRPGKDNTFYRKYVMNYTAGRVYTRFIVKDLDIPNHHTKYHWDKFEAFEDLGVVDSVYDLMDQPETRFVANGVIVHNCELRILAYLSQDPDIIQTYVDDGDLHDAVATKMFGPEFTKEQRVGAKTVNFGQ